MSPLYPKQTFISYDDLLSRGTEKAKSTQWKPLLMNSEEFRLHSHETLQIARFCVMEIRKVVRQHVAKKTNQRPMPWTIEHASEKKINAWITHEWERRTESLLPPGKQMEYTMAQPLMYSSSQGLTDFNRAIQENLIVINRWLDEMEKNEPALLRILRPTDTDGVLAEEYSSPLQEISASQLLLKETAVTKHCFKDEVQINMPVQLSHICQTYKHTSMQELWPYKPVPLPENFPMPITDK